MSTATPSAQNPVTVGAVVQSKINLQMDRLGKMERNVVNHRKYNADRCTPHHLRSRISLYLTEYGDFLKTHDEIRIALPNKTGVTYFDDDVAQTFEDAYLNVNAAANEKLESVIAERNANAANTSTATLHDVSINGEPNEMLIHAINSLRTSAANEVRLQPAKLPSFSGKYIDWRPFRDQFIAFIHNGKHAKVLKLQYLLGALDGSPAKPIISHLPVTEASYDAAWELLTNRYENPRAVFSNAMSNLCSFPTCEIESVDNLQQLSSLVNQTIECLKDLKVNVTDTDPILAYLIIEKLSPSSRVEFEKSVSAKTTLPTVKDVSTCIGTSQRTLELLGAATTETKQQQYNNNKHKTSSAAQSPTQSNRTNYQSQKSRSVKSFHFGAKSKTNNKANETNAFKCPLSCDTEHPSIRTCTKFLALSSQDRVATVEKGRFCRNCLGHNHLVASCFSTKNCGTCGGRHHTLIHIPTPANVQTNDSAATTTSVTMNTNTNTHTTFPLFRSTLLSTAIVQVCDRQGNKRNLRALIDSGGEVSAITESAVQFLQLKKTHCTVNVTHLDDVQSNSKSCVNFVIQTINSPFTMEIQALVMKTLVARLPSREIHHTNWPHIAGLTLADPHFNRSAPIDIILGAEVYAEIVRAECVRGPIGTPTAQSTELGWILFGKAYSKSDTPTTVAMHHNSVDELLEKFFEIENVGDIRAHTNDEQYCIDFYKRTHQRDANGRFVLELPFRTAVDSTAVLGRSRGIALRQFLQLERKFARDVNLKSEYVKCINDYLQLNHAQVMTDTESDHLVVNENGQHSYTSCYLPHHHVTKETSTSTRLRVVFNAAKPTSNGKSLNSIMFPGPVLLNDLFGILINWRFHKIAFVGDITKMYRQILLHPEYITYHRFLFRADPSEEIKEYALNRLTFGTNYAPCGAIQTLHSLAAQHRNDKPEAADVIEMDTYMDDTILGADDVPSALRIQRDLLNILQSAGFQLKKWASNSNEVLQAVPEADREVNIPLSIDQNDCVKALGIYWNTAKDAFGFSINFESHRNKLLTKRIVLSIIARLFDPLGLLAPVIVKAKIFMKKLWKLNLAWDDPLPDTVSNEWHKFTANLECLHTIKIDRWIGTKKGESTQLHLFCDASVDAFGVAAYIRSVDEHGNVTTNIIASKSKVSPVKPMTIPRLELSAAVLLTYLLAKLRKLIRQTRIRPEDIWLWSDAQIVLHWIKGDADRWKVFVSNRISEILKRSSKEQWHYVNTHDNPADIVSRGMLPFDLNNNDLWFTGPSWLRLPEENWPTKDTIQMTPKDEALIDGERSSVTINVITQSGSCDTLLQYCSSYTQLLRYSCWLVRFGEFLRNKTIHRSKYLTPVEINAVRLRWVKYVQYKHFQNEIKLTRNNIQELKTKNRLWALNPFIDEDDLLRVGGRLSRAQMNYNEKHPFIVPPESHFTQLLIHYAHRQTLHGGAQLSLAYLRKRYWILNGRNTVRTKINKCIVCFRQRGETAQQLMADLPACRVRQPIRPFLHTGVDMCGPVSIRISRLRGSKVHKGYIVLFICMAIKAVHLEPVVDASSDSFLSAFQRFVSRRGLCTDLYADNGTNFVGAKRILQREEVEYLQSIHKDLVNTLANDSVTFHFNPPSAPSFGGLWESNIRCVKHHLIRTVGDISMTYDDLATTLARIESCLNSRPLIPMSSDPDDHTYITPGHFLIGDSLLAIPEPILFEEKVAIGDYYRMRSKRVQSFWTQWQNDYLKMLQQRPKWLTVKENLRIGNIVFIKDERLPPNKWLLGKVIDIHPGSDELVRVCTVKTANGIYKRPINKLSLLPIKENESVGNLIESTETIDLNGESEDL